MRVPAEALARRDAIFIDDAERTKAHVSRVVVIGERERVKAVEPTVLGVPSVIGFADVDHDAAP
jgi:hypothetical protein